MITVMNLGSGIEKTFDTDDPKRAVCLASMKDNEIAGAHSNGTLEGIIEEKMKHVIYGTWFVFYGDWGARIPRKEKGK